MNKQDIISAVENYGSYGKLYLPNGKRVYNEWNAWVTGVYYNERYGLFVSVYVQGDSTDEDDSVRFDEFLKGGSYRGVTSYHNFRFTFDQSEKKKAINAICEYVAELNRGLGDKQKTLKRLTHYSLINPILDDYYDRKRLKFNPTLTNAKYATMGDVATSKSYSAAESHLKDYIKGNFEELAGKTDDELTAIYRKVFNQFADEFVKTFTREDFEEWRSHHWFF